MGFPLLPAGISGASARISQQRGRNDPGRDIDAAIERATAALSAREAARQHERERSDHEHPGLGAARSSAAVLRGDSPGSPAEQAGKWHRAAPSWIRALGAARPLLPKE